MKLVESHEPWFGQVPTDWIRSRIRNVAMLSPSFSDTPPTADESCTIVPMELLSEDGLIDISNQKSVEEAQSGLTLFEQGDVLFAKITPCMENGKGAFVGTLPTRYAFGSTEFHVLRPSQKVDGKFLYYATFNPIFRVYAAENMIGAAGHKRVTSRLLRDTRLFLPSFSEQQRIAAYLDASCGAIDAAVAAKRLQLETLDKLRKSTIQRALTEGLAESPNLAETQSHVIPKISEKWRLDRLKDVADIRYGLGQPPKEQKNGVPIIRATNVHAGRITDQDLLLVDRNDLPLGRNPYLKQDEIIVVRSGAYTGDSAIVPSKYDGAVAGYDMVVTVTRAEPKFIAYGLLSGYILEGQMLLLTLRAAQPHLNAEELGSIVFALPPSRAEQQAIITFLDTKLAEISLIKTTIGHQITTLTAYRKSLIHECVIGQRRITEADVAQAHREEK